MPTIKHKVLDNTRPIHPDHIIRYCDGPLYFGYGVTQLDEKIKSGEIPMPISLSDSGRARGWLGKVILAWQAEREIKATAKAASAKLARKAG
jgi:predicted DNA-binding transcriptional regulator AlpA